MTNSKHTPGPWDQDEDRVISKTTGETLAQVFAIEGDHSKRYGEGPSDYNHRLFTAAPELFEACELVLAAATVDMPAELMRAVSQAVAKAKGEK